MNPESKKPLTAAEGERRGREDRAARLAYDPDRWVKRWARDFWKFEEGYARGYRADVERDGSAGSATRSEAT